MNYDLHEKANNLMELHKEMNYRIEHLTLCFTGASLFPAFQAKYFNRIDTCKRGLERIEQAYIKVLTEILAV